MMKKRIFSLLLCIVMCLSLFPMSAFAEVTPAEMAFRFQVTVNGNEPSDEEFGKFTFYFDELKRPGLSNPWENLRTAENGSINGSGDINFRSLDYSYGDEGTHWYRFYEDQEKIKDYTLDQTVFYLKVVILEDGVGADTEFRIYETRAYKAPFGADVYDNAGVVDRDKLTAIALDDIVFANTYGDPADYSEVTDALNACKALKASDYTSDSWQVLQDAINGVVYDLDADHQAEVDAMAKTIVDAIDALEAAHTHDFTGAYKDNEDGTHSRKCTGCDEYDTAEAHSYTNGVCVCGATQSPTPYIFYTMDSNGALTQVDKECKTYEVVTSTTTSFGDGEWYVADGNITVGDRIMVNGTANLILKDGAKLTAQAGINVAEGNTLNIYAQSEDAAAMGQLIAVGSDDNDTAGIGGGKSQNGGTVTIYGGSVTATGGWMSAGIGGGFKYSKGGTVTIYSGAVTANGGYSAAGIGGGDGGNGGNVTIYGGTVTAIGYKYCSGIGGGFNSWDDGTLTLGRQVCFEAGDSAEKIDGNATKDNFGKYDYIHTTTSDVALYETTVDSSIKNGAVTVDKATCASGEIVTLTATPADGYEFDSWNVTDKNGDPVTVNEQNQFTMPESDVTVKATFVMNLETAKEYTKNAIDELVPADASDELKAAAEKAKAAVDAAETMDEIGAACDEFSETYYFLQDKEELIAELEEGLKSDKYSDAFKALVEEILDAVKAADSMDAIDAIEDEYAPKLELQEDKDEACAAIEELLPDDASDAVKKIFSDACDKIQASDDSTGFDSFVNETRLAIEAQLQKEAELAPAKEAAIAEINKAKTDANASVAEDAIKAINDATSVDEVNKLKEQALADMAKADAAAELDAAKKSAIDRINGYKSDVNASIADAAIADINKATTTTEVSNIVNQAIPNLLAADKKAEFKGKITNELLPAAKCDEAKAILNKALTDLDDAVTLDDVNGIFYTAQGQAGGKDSEFEGKRNGYTSMFNSLLTENATDETKAYAADMKQALADATSIAQVDEIYNNNVSKVGLYYNRDKNVADFNKYIDSDEYSDEMKAIAQEAIEKLMQAESVSDVEKITKDYKLKLDVQEDKETMREVLASDEYSDEMKALAQNALDELDDVTTSQELTNLWDKYNPLMRLQLTKDDARKEVKELLPENASDAVKKIVSDACDEIQANDDPDQYADIIEAAAKAIEAQLQKEKELAPAKEAAIAEINDAKTDANASVAEDAVKAINNAQSEDEISALKEQALDDMAAADAAAELAEAKETAKEAILAEQGDDTSEAVAKAVEEAIAAIDAATTVDEVNAAMEDGIAAIRAAKAGNVPLTPVTYTIIDGANSTWTKGSTSELVIRSDAPFAKFVGVKVDGKTIAATNYTAKEGSTIVTLTPAYLETLEVGTHSLEIVSNDGSASTNFTVKANSQPADSTDPRTGDSSMIYLWTLILVVSAAGLSATTIYSRKRKHN